MWNTILEALFGKTIQFKEIASPKKNITESVTPKLTLIEGGIPPEVTYPLIEEDFEDFVRFLIEQPDEMKVFINVTFVKSLVEEIGTLREDKRKRLRITY